MPLIYTGDEKLKGRMMTVEWIIFSVLECFISVSCG